MGNSDAFFQGFISVKKLLAFVILNISPFSSHLWYLGAILNVYIIAVCCRTNSCLKQITGKVLPFLVPVLLLGDLILGKYSCLLFHREFSYLFVRNFLFVGIPYFTIGFYIKKKESSLVQIGRHKKLMLFLIVLFCLTTILERWLLVAFDLNTTRDHYISTTFLSIVLFIVFTDCSWNERKLRFAKLIGRKHSTMIYIIHPLIINTIAVMINKRAYDLFGFIEPVIVFLLALIFSALYNYMLELFLYEKK